MVFFCQFCCFSSLEWKTLLRHTFEAHSNVPGFNFMCGIDGCSQTFQTYSGITSHLRRKHRGRDLNEQPVALSQLDDTNTDQTPADICMIDDSDDTATPGQQREAPDNTLERSAALFLLCLKERFQISQTAIDFAVSQVQHMVTFAIEDIQHAVECYLQSLSTESPPDIAAIIECFTVPDPFTNLQNEYMQTKYYKENFELIVSCI